MYKLDWSLFDRNGSKIFRYDKINQQVEFYQKVTVHQPIYTTKIENIDQINVFTDKQVKDFFFLMIIKKNFVCID